MFDPATILLLTNAIRWWGALAGFVNLADLGQYVKSFFDDDCYSSLKGKDIKYVANISISSILLIVAGVLMPMTLGLPGTEHLWFVISIGIIWTFISVAGWGLAIKFAESKKYMGWVAILALPILVTASLLSGV